MSAIAEVKPLSFSHAGKQKAYEFLLLHPGADFAAYLIMGENPNISEKEFIEVQRAIAVSTGSDADFESAENKLKINPDIYFAKKEHTRKSNMKSKGVDMAKGTNITAAPKRRGRPPGSKKVASTEVKVKGKRGRPAKVKSPTNLSESKKGGQGTRYPAERQQEIVNFIVSKGRGGLSQAKEKFGISYPTLARWIKQAGGQKRAAKPDMVSKKHRGTTESVAVHKSHVLISKKVLKEFQKGIANLEKAFGAFSNALRVLE